MCISRALGRKWTYRDWTFVVVVVVDQSQDAREWDRPNEPTCSAPDSFYIKKILHTHTHTYIPCAHFSARTLLVLLLTLGLYIFVQKKKQRVKKKKSLYTVFTKKKVCWKFWNILYICSEERKKNEKERAISAGSVWRPLNTAIIISLNVQS